MQYDVVAVSIRDSTVRVLDEKLDERNADAVIKFAVMRRGVDEEYYFSVPHGTYRNGDTRDEAKELRHRWL